MCYLDTTKAASRIDLSTRSCCGSLHRFKRALRLTTDWNSQRARPSIPRDIDRALLLDASDVMEKYDLDEGIWYRLRARFWDKYDQG